MNQQKLKGVRGMHTLCRSQEKFQCMHMAYKYRNESKRVKRRQKRNKYFKIKQVGL